MALRGGRGWRGPEVTPRGEEQKEEEEEEMERGRGAWVSFTPFSSPQLFYEGRNIIFSTQASPCCDP